MTQNFSDLAAAVDWIRGRIEERQTNVKAACAAAGVSRGGFYQVVENPSSLGAGDFARLCTSLEISDDDIVAIIQVWLRARAMKTVLGPAVSVLLDSIDAMPHRKKKQVYLDVIKSFDEMTPRTGQAS